MTAEATGSLAVLNVGAGDIEVRFDPHDPAEAAKAIKMLTDMRSRGYAVLVRDEDGAYTRAVDLDASRGRYVILLPTADVAEGKPLAADAELHTCQCGCGKKVTPGKTWVRGHWNRKAGSRGRVKASVPVAGRHAVGVARSAGG